MPPKRQQKRKTAPTASKELAKVPPKRAKTEGTLLKQTDAACTVAGVGIPTKRQRKRKTAPTTSKESAKAPPKRAKTNGTLLKQTDAACITAGFRCPNPLCARTFPSMAGIGLHYLRHSVCDKVVQALRTQKSYDRGPDQGTAQNRHSSMQQRNDAVGVEAMEDNADDNADDSVVDNALRETRPVAASAQDYGTTFTLEDQTQTELLKMLNDAHAPHSLFESVNDWALRAHTSGYGFNPAHRTRKGQITYMVKWQNLSKCRPFQIPTTFPEDGLSVNITAWNFETQIRSLLADKLLTGNIDNLDVNPDDPFAKYAPPDGRIGCFNSAQWYNDAWDRLVGPDSNDWMCPIIWTCDETLVGSHLARTGVTPLLFTLSIFSEEIRAKNTAWRPLGFIYDLTQHGKGMRTLNVNKSRKLNKHEKAQRYHRVVQNILETYVTSQRNGGVKDIKVQLGLFSKSPRRMLNPTAMILGDMQGGDKHCGSSVSYSKAQGRLCRACNVAGDEAGNPWVKCGRMSMNKIRDYVVNGDLEALQQINQYNVYSAWFDVDYGRCPRGIFSAAMPVEALHALEGGLILNCLNILFEEDLKPARCGDLDNLAIEMCGWESQFYLHAGSDKDLPRTLFKDGVTSITKISHSYIVGMMLTIVIITLRDDGKEFLAKVCGTSKRVNDTRYVFSMLLCYWSWLRKDHYWKRGDHKAKATALQSIRLMLQEILRRWPRDKGNGWFLAKFHEQLHVPYDIERNGTPRGTYTGPTERLHKKLKQHSLRTQRRRDVHDKQLGDREFETFVIDFCSDRMTADYSTLFGQNPVEDINEEWSMSQGATRGLMELEYDDNHPDQPKSTFRWLTPGAVQNKTVPFDEKVFECIRDELRVDIKNRYFEEDGNQTRAQLFTECKIGGVVYRAHPCYRNEKAWHDWVMVRYSRGEDGKTYREAGYDDEVGFCDSESVSADHEYAPAKILGFYLDPRYDEMQAVIQCCAFKHIRSSPISTYWKQEYTHRNKSWIISIGVQSIVRQCLMIPENDQKEGFHEIWSRERWADAFCNV